MITDKMAAAGNEEACKALQGNLKEFNPRMVTLSTLAQKGDDKLVDRFLTENVQIEGDANQKTQSQLYIACFWGFYDVVKNLLDNGADLNIQNKFTGWTPLHAAAFQEHGKIVMLLLERHANPEIPDSEGRTASDFASASDKIWSHFAALGCTRTSKQDLIQKGIIRKLTKDEIDVTSAAGIIPGSSKLAAFSRPGSSYVLSRDPFVVDGAAKFQGSSPLVNDILGKTCLDKQNDSNHGHQPTFSVWRT